MQEEDLALSTFVLAENDPFFDKKHQKSKTEKDS